MARFKRILLKLSVESLMGKQGYGIDPERLSDYAQQIKEISETGVEIGIVIGGGNIFRGLSGSQKGFDRVKGDQMGMCATVINSLALSSALGAIGVKNKVLTAIRMEPIGEFHFIAVGKASMSVLSLIGGSLGSSMKITLIMPGSLAPSLVSVSV